MLLKSAAILLIYKDFLLGIEKNCDIQFLLNRLTTQGYDVDKFVSLKENENQKYISHEIQELSKHHDIVIVIEKLQTNVSCQALADACFVECNKTSGRFAGSFKEANAELDENKILIPCHSKLVFSSHNVFPVIFIQRIFVMKLEQIKEQYSLFLEKHLSFYRSGTIFYKCIKFAEGARIGSIKEKLDNGIISATEVNNSTVLRIEASDLLSLNNSLNNTVAEFGSKIQKVYVPPLDESRLNYDDVTLINSAQDDIAKAFEIYGVKNVFIAFNGGKDSTVLLHLMNSVLQSKYPDSRAPIICLYVESEQPFAEENDFLEQCSQYYNLEVEIIQSDVKTALTKILNKRPNLKACLMGTRRTDPYSRNLSTFQMCDRGWPEVMRVNPLLDWHHSDIWDFLLYYKVPYCKLYDMGYTSVGSVTNTVKNPSLRYRDVIEDKEKYLPAYKLLNQADERLGRHSANLNSNL